MAWYYGDRLKSVWSKVGKGNIVGAVGDAFNMPANFNAIGSDAKQVLNGFNKAFDVTGEQAMNNQVAANSALWQQNADFAAQEAQKDRDFQERMSNTAYQRAFNDLKAAGYNPYIALTSGSAASTPGGASATSSAASVSRQENRSLDVLTKAVEGAIKVGTSSSQNMTSIAKIIAFAMLA